MAVVAALVVASDRLGRRPTTPISTTCPSDQENLTDASRPFPQAR
jgi:hypothetical protein